MMDATELIAELRRLYLTDGIDAVSDAADLIERQQAVIDIDWKGVILRSGFDLSCCMKCGEMVVCLPDGMPMCSKCADEEEAKEKGKCPRCGDAGYYYEGYGAMMDREPTRCDCEQARREAAEKARTR